MHFVKMHGIGNDYVYLDAVTDPSIERRADLPDLARRISDRHRGVGSDGLILVCRPGAGAASRRAAGCGTHPGAHVRMRMFNADGSESEMCGNGVRCVAKFAHDRLGVRADPILVETGRGSLPIAYETVAGKLTRATVDMGEPILEPSRVPVAVGKLEVAGEHRYRLRTGDDAWVGSFASMGNPHAVFFDADNPGLRGDGLAAIDLARVGPRIERHPAFPDRINAHFVRVQAPGEAAMRTWERGAGATLACGTGACAAAVAGARLGLLDRSVTLHLPGGDLGIVWSAATNHVLMTGPATDVFEGQWRE
ncbi:MAG: diaminopimelate epimerase [Phycisphaerales bacterium]|nr:diaminopimelate epimerase [Phycisphaerales bacterium]